MYKIGLVTYILDSFTFRSRTFHIFSLSRLRSPSTIAWSKYDVSGSFFYQLLDQNKKRVEIGKRHYRSPKRLLNTKQIPILDFILSVLKVFFIIMQETIYKPIAMCKETFNHGNLLSLLSGSIKETYTNQQSN